MTHILQTRITLASTANDDGSDKLLPSFIGLANIPRCYNKNTKKQLGYLDRHNAKVRMIGRLFQECIFVVDKPMQVWLQPFIPTNCHIILQRSDK